MATASEPKAGVFNVPMPSARIINVPSPIEKFKGSVASKFDCNTTGPTITRWVEQLENYFISEHIIQDDLKISEAKRYVDVSHGDAKDVITLPHIKALRKWENFKKALFDLYRTKSEENPFVAWEEFNSLVWKPNESLLRYLTRAEELAEKVTKSFKVHFGTDLPESATKLTIWSHIYKRMPNNKQDTIFAKVKINKDVTEQTLDFMRDELNRNPVTIVRHVENIRSVEFEPKVTEYSNQNKPLQKPYHQSNRLNRNVKYDDWSNRNERSKNSGWNTDKETEKNKTKICYKCRRQGHIAKDCRVKLFFRE